MIPMPIFLPINTGGSDTAYQYPEWVTYFVAIAFSITIVGLIMLLIDFVFDLILEIAPDWLLTASVITAIGGMIFLIIGLVLMLITGVKIE